jgi:MYXO-CTERM domain-containing protein
MRRAMWSSWLVLAISGAALAAAGCQETNVLPAPVEATSAPIVNGAEDDGDPAVVLISGEDNHGQGFFCSGTLVAPRVILTARHCVRDEEGDLSLFTPGSHKVSFHTGWPGDPSVFVDTTGFDAMPGIQNDFGTDIALLYLAADAPANIKPIPVSSYASALFQGQALRLVGYGITVHEGTDYGVKRAGSTKVTVLETEILHHLLDPSGTCEGDSGGPQLVKLGNVEVVAAVTSYGNVGCQTDHGAVRTDAHLDFLMQHYDAVEKVPPVVAITAPAEGADVAPGFTVTADITDNYAVLGASLIVDGTPSGSDQKAPWVLQAPSNVTVGSHTVELEAVDIFGNVTTKSITVNVKPACAGDSECADGQICSNGICGLDIGADCHAPGDCVSGQCYQSSDSAFCTINCASASECPSGFTCAASGISPVTKCVPAEASGCAIGTATAHGSRVPFVAAMLMLGLLLGLRFRRRDS